MKTFKERLCLCSLHLTKSRIINEILVFTYIVRTCITISQNVTIDFGL